MSSLPCRRAPSWLLMGCVGLASVHPITSSLKNVVIGMVYRLVRWAVQRMMIEQKSLTETEQKPLVDRRRTARTAKNADAAWRPGLTPIPEADEEEWDSDDAASWLPNKDAASEASTDDSSHCTDEAVYDDEDDVVFGVDVDIHLCLQGLNSTIDLCEDVSYSYRLD